MMGSGHAELDQQADGTSSCHGEMALTAKFKKSRSELKILNLQIYLFFMNDCNVALAMLRLHTGSCNDNSQ
jgi:hypothetical protein